MNFWSVHSKRELDTLHPDLVALFTIVLQIWDCKINQGFRPQADQDLAFLTGNTTVQWPNSKHNQFRSMAADVFPFVEGTFIGWHTVKPWFAFAGVVFGVAAVLYDQGIMTHKVRWGGDWDGDWNFKDQKFNDWPHFELV